MEQVNYVTDQTPLAMMTLGQLKEALELNKPTITVQEKEKKYVYGIRGIRELFHVSKVTAQKLKDGILRPSVMQLGRKITTDADMAISLYREATQKNK